MKTAKTQPVIHSRGFTLVELVVVILILGILAINVGSRFFTGSAFSDRKVADELIEAIRYAQHLAMSRGGDITTSGNIRVVTTSSSYTVELFDGTSSTAIPNPNRSGDYTVEIPSDSSLTAKTISFNGLGQPTPDEDTIISVGSSFTITIEQETGYAHY